MWSVLGAVASFKNPFQSYASKKQEKQQVAVKTSSAEPDSLHSNDPTPTGVSASDTGAVAEQLFDELLAAPVYRYDQYQELLQREIETPGTTVLEKRYWGYPRRWKVILWGIKLRSTLPNTVLNAAFVEFEIGGNREEVRVELGSKTNVYALGHMKCRLQTGLVYGLRGMEDAFEVPYRKYIEYWGSYADLTQEHVKVRLWSYQNFSLNRLEGLASEVLESSPAGPIYREKSLYKPVEGKRILCGVISYNLYFQEIYDFELQFFQWRVFGYQTVRELEYLLSMLERQPTATAPPSSLETIIKPLGFLKNQRSVLEEKTTPQEPKGLKKGNQKQTPAAEKTMSECMPRLLFTLKSSIAYKKGLQLSSTILKNNVRPYWEHVGTLYFRGTIYELESAVLHVEVQDVAASRHRTVAKGNMTLKGVVDYAYLQASLRAPGWLATTTSAKLRQAMQSWAFGSVEGKISISNTPLYRQTGEVGTIDKTRVNLFISIDRIDSVVTLEERQDVSPFIQVSFDGDARSTRTISKTTNPVFDELLVFPLQLPPKEELTVIDIEQKGLLWIDVWSAGCVANDHCGGASLCLRELFFDLKNHERPMESVRVVDSETGNPLCYNTRKVEFKKPLKFAFPTDRTSHVTFSAWTMPDLLKYTALRTIQTPISMSLPPTLQSRMEDYEIAFDAECCRQASKLEPHTRYYYCYALDQRLVCQFLPALCGKLVPPKFVDNCNAVAQYVRCVQFAPPRRVSSTMSPESNSISVPGDAVRKTGLSRIWATPEFTLAGRSGSIPDHALLHVSLLMGLSYQAFVCVGSLWDRSHHVWVCTFHFHEEGEKSYGYVRFWETTSGQIYFLKNRFRNRQVIKEVFVKVQCADAAVPLTAQKQFKRKGRHFFRTRQGREREKEPSAGDLLNAEFMLDNELEDDQGRPRVPGPQLPYRSLDFLFNHLNIWVNKQDPDPGKLWFDLWRENFWHQFTPENYDVKPCFAPRVMGRMASEADVAATVAQIKEVCKRTVSEFRASRNATTRWNNDPDLQQFLVKGLQLLHFMEMARDDDMRLAELKRRDWQKALYAKVPLSCRLKGATFHFNRSDSPAIADTLVRRCDFFDCRARSVTFALAAYMRVFPGQLSGVYVLVLLVHRVPERERRKLREQRNKKRREKAVRRLVQKRRSSVTVGDEAPPTAERMRAEPPFEAAKEPKNRETLESDLSPTVLEKQPSCVPDASRTESDTTGADNAPQPAVDASREGMTQPFHKKPYEGGVSKSKDGVNEQRNAFRDSLSNDSGFFNGSKAFGDVKLQQNVASKQKPVAKKSLKVLFPPETLRLVLRTSANAFSPPWDDPELFRPLLHLVESSIADGLRVPSKRVKAYSCDYRRGSVTLAILPPSARSSEPAEQLFDELLASFTDICQQHPKLLDLTNGDVFFERGLPTSKVAKNTLTPSSAATAVVEESNVKEQFFNSPENAGVVSRRTSLRKLKKKVSGQPKRQLRGKKRSKKSRKSEKQMPLTASPTPEPVEQEESAARRQFYEEMSAADPQLFSQLLKYYETQGHTRDHALYFAAYYTAMKIYQKPPQQSPNAGPPS